MSRFADYVKSTAFNLQLTKNQIKLLQALILPSNSINFLINVEPSAQSLYRKGLVNIDAKEITLTAEGLLLVPLLVSAGLLVLKTKPLITTTDMKHFNRKLSK